jgi:hypothetical protein
LYGNGITSGDHRIGTASYLSATLNVQARSATERGTVIRGAASQTANLQEWQNSAGGILTRLDSIGNYFGDRLNIGGAVFGEVASPYFGKINVLQEPGGHAIAMRGRDSQTTPIARIRVGATPGSGNDALLIENSFATALARVDSGGYMGLQGGLFMLNGRGAFEQAFGGAFLQMDRATSLPTSPGANKGRMYFRDGTNAGTLKLVVRAGAAGAETTILDNIPQ